MMKRVYLVFFVLLYITIPCIGLTEGETPGLSITPTQLNLSSEPGKEISGEIIIRNTAQKAVSLKNYPQDIISTLSGTTYGLLPEDDPYSVARWIIPEQDSFDISAQDTAKARYTLKIPYSVKAGSYWAIIFFETENDDISETDHVSISGRIGIKVFIEVQELELSQVTDFKIKRNPYSPNDIKFYITLENLGSINTQPEGKLRINRVSDLRDEISFKTSNLTPGQSETIELNYKHTITFSSFNAILQFDNETIKNGSAIDFWGINLGFWSILIIATLVMLAVIFSIILIKVRKRGTKYEKSEKEKYKKERIKKRKTWMDIH